MAISVWIVKTTVLTALEDGLLTDYADVVQLGLPTELPSVAQQRRVYILDVPPYEQSPVYSPSMQAREEEYVIPIALEVETVLGPRSTYQDAMTAMATLVAAIETIQAGNWHWKGTCFTSGISLAGESNGQLPDVAGGFLSKTLLQLHIITHGN